MAIGLMLCAVVTFTCLDTTAKYLVTTASLPVSEVVWVRFTAHALFTFVLLRGLGRRATLKSKKPGQQALRSLFMFGATALNFLALKYLQLDQTVTIFFLTPLLVAALAGPLLGEWVGWRRLLAILVGFAGVLIVIRPGFGGIHWAASLSFLAMICYALYNISTRYLSRYDPPEVTQLYTPLAGILLMAPLAFLDWQMPSGLTIWLILATLGFWGGLSHWLLILAHRHAPAPVLAPFIYIDLLTNSVMQYFVFGDVPSPWTLAGGAVVITSGLYLLARERKAEPGKDGGPASDIAAL